MGSRLQKERTTDHDDDPDENADTAEKRSRCANRTEGIVGQNTRETDEEENDERNDRPLEHCPCQNDRH